jgi:hypothetical protein
VYALVELKNGQWASLLSWISRSRGMFHDVESGHGSTWTVSEYREAAIRLGLHSTAGKLLGVDGDEWAVAEDFCLERGLMGEWRAGKRGC